MHCCQFGISTSLLYHIGFPASGHMLFPQLAMHHQLFRRCWTLVCMHMCLGDVPRKMQVEEFEQGIINVLGLISKR
ncbi:hypothetical protein O9993_16000 [Vibrio lentus]|nr:hypothetical protein [Vibrio lentus]